ncbi:isoprenyl transferase [Bacillus sonorensis]|uniref:Isoprenyl transferase n=2 Tax=Bacillus sonorensis TaxID=119858 RepID=M5P481_9BACI|nr:MULTISPECIES: isoprenyl transferase [Bacillus]TWK72006.1 Ditrans,polycis-undecaprenyl-diphosphate synthase ((2E,6E)-farnesyl-diphosphate specific) [Bacillus paralicheniformis]ASB89585.1 Ditrans,polycis-undecaprenyl-diphosphate synthase ((2E,6E)-farnesyl-diphosphate specific) [Bacillus sonorensis]EME74263.1 undecaprenyl pyrophosphate synthase [Bacillus sonorensis L12]MBG9917142.1 UDP pyrophosphate synthase [Bacillus sonorensis]MCF7618841.1 isoprenyl transferase [Bacillus sonorensis]
MLNILKNWKNQHSAASNMECYTKENILKGEIPEHIAIIMDGNGRWAKKRAMPRIAGHHEGMKVVRETTKLANELGVKALTLYAFSTENWKRPKLEVDFLMKLPEEFLNTYLPELIDENVQVRITGDKNGLPPHTIRAVEKAISDTENNDGLILNFALNYGGRAEIANAAKRIAEEAKKGNVNIEEIDEKLFSDYLMTETLQDPDLLIRTSGEIRLSNFMLWQLAYSEFLFTDVLWPDFKEVHFLQAIGEYQRRGRRFGGI